MSVVEHTQELVRVLLRACQSSNSLLHKYAIGRMTPLCSGAVAASRQNVPCLQWRSYFLQSRAGATHYVLQSETVRVLSKTSRTQIEVPRQVEGAPELLPLCRCICGEG